MAMIQHRRTAWAVLLILLMLALWLSGHRGVSLYRRNAPEIAVSHAQRALSFTIPEITKPSGTTTADAALRAASALKKIRRGYQAVLDAPSYRRTMTSAYSNGTYAIFTLSRKRDSSGKLRFYSETVNYNGKSFEPIPGLSRYELVNEQGYYEWNDKVAADGVVFALTNPGEPANTSGMEREIAEWAQNDAPHLELFDYHESRQVRAGKSVDVVTVTGVNNAKNTTSEYVFDPGSGALLSSVFVSGLTFTESYEVNAAIDDAVFTVPSDALIVPTANVDAATRQLEEKTKP